MQCSPASGAFASVAICESRANTNSPCSLGSPATSGQMGVFHRDSESCRERTATAKTNSFTSRSTSLRSLCPSTVTVSNGAFPEGTVVRG